MNELDKKIAKEIRKIKETNASLLYYVEIYVNGMIAALTTK